MNRNLYGWPQQDCAVINDGWRQWPLGQFIADYGVPHFEESMAAMLELTQRFTSEFALRPFIEEYPDRVFDRLQSWTSHPNPHVRRWCSEGIRPRLPWGRKLRSLVADPTPIWPILESLKDDPEIYVRRSVANNLNDIAKDHPGEVIRCCRRWMKGRGRERKWVVNRALRSLIKDGNPDALSVMGFSKPKAVSVALSLKPRTIKISESVECTITLVNHAKSRQRLAIDYVVHFVRKSGTSIPKVFKWTVVEIAAGGTVALTKRHPMRLTTKLLKSPRRAIIA